MSMRVIGIYKLILKCAVDMFMYEPRRGVVSKNDDDKEGTSP